MRPRLAIFDCDGTLVDGQNGIVAAMGQAFAMEGLDVPSRPTVLGVVGLSLPEAFERLATAHAPRVRNRLAANFREAAAMLRSNPDHAEPLFSGAAVVIEALAKREDMQLGIATGKSRRGVDRLLGRHGWAGHFVTIQTADDNPSKPHPAMITRACAHAGVDPREAVMIGDTSFDMMMAINAGAGAIGVTWGYHPRHEIVDAGAHAIVDHFDQLIAVIDTLMPLQNTVGGDK